MNSRLEDVASGHAIVDALLRERLGGEAVPDLTANVLARASRGDGAGAAARLRRAERGLAGAGSSRGRWRVAALVLLGLGIVMAITMSRRGATEQQTQQPERPEPPSPAPAQDPEIVPVQSIEQLQQLLPQTVGLTIEMWRLPEWRIDLAATAAPFRCDPAVATTFAAALAKDVRSETSAGWKWGHRLRLLLRDGRAVELAFDDQGLLPDGRGRVGVRGLQGDGSVSTATVQLLKEPWRQATLAAQVANGLMVTTRDLAVDAAAFRDCGSLTLASTGTQAEIKAADLARLTDFPKLRRLDVSRMAKGAEAEALTHIGMLVRLEELVLDGMPVDDAALRPIGEMPNLRRLSLRGCKHVRGDALLQSRDGLSSPALPFRALEALDLSDCPGLQDFTLPNLGAMPRLKELRLANAALPADDQRWSIFRLATKVEVLDLSGHPFSQERLRGIAELTTLHTLVLRDCALDDSDLAVLARTRSPLRILRLGGNPALTLAGVKPVRELPSLVEIDLRGNQLGDTKEDWLEMRPGQRIWLR